MKSITSKCYVVHNIDMKHISMSTDDDHCEHSCDKRLLSLVTLLMKASPKSAFTADTLGALNSTRVHAVTILPGQCRLHTDVSSRRNLH